MFCVSLVTLMFSECPHGTFGEKCLSDCFPNCKGNCDHVSGICKHGCVDGWTGQMCDNGKIIL